MIKRLAAIAAVATAALALAVPANAAARPADASGCNADACISVQTGVMIEVVPSTNGFPFYGHWQYLTPTEHVDSGPNGAQFGEGPGHTFWDGSGQYCVIAWAYNQSTGVYTNLGEPCETVT